MKLMAHRWYITKSTAEATGWHYENSVYPPPQHIPPCGVPAWEWGNPSVRIIWASTAMMSTGGKKKKKRILCQGFAPGHPPTCIYHFFLKHQLCSNTYICVYTLMLTFSMVQLFAENLESSLCISSRRFEIQSSDYSPSCQLYTNFLVAMPNYHWVVRELLFTFNQYACLYPIKLQSDCYAKLLFPNSSSWQRLIEGIQSIMWNCSSVLKIKIVECDS